MRVASAISGATHTRRSAGSAQHRRRNSEEVPRWQLRAWPRRELARLPAARSRQDRERAATSRTAADRDVRDVYPA